MTISAKSRKGFVVGRLSKNTTIVLQYVGGKWKAWGSRADISPDRTGGRGGKRRRLAIIALAADGGTSQVLALVPEGTKSNPFSFQLLHDVEELVLRINDNDQWRGNPGKVQYKLTVRPP